MRTLDDDEAERLIDDVKRAVELVDDEDLSPDDAIHKIAEERGHGPGTIRLLAASYNTGRQTAQRQAGGDVFAKLAHFPLADAQAVIDRRYGPAPKAAASIDPDYASPPDWLPGPRPDEVQTRVKAACEAPPVAVPSPRPSLEKTLHAIDRAKRARDEARVRKSAAEDSLTARVGGVVSYFAGRYPIDRLPFPLVEKAACAYLGPRAPYLMELVWNRSQVGERFGEKRAADQVVRGPIDRDAEPLRRLGSCLEATDELLKASAALEQAEAGLGAAEAALRPFCPAPPVQKAGFLLSGPAMGAAVGSILTRSLGEMPKTKDELVDDAMKDLDDPRHQSELRKIQTHAMLNSMMTDPDDPISSHSPDEVLQAYNELAQLAPRTALYTAAIKPLLRRQLSGRVEPFEAKEVSEIEKNLSPASRQVPQVGPPK